jgi:hypothetical protein
MPCAHPLKAAFDAGAPVDTAHEPGFVNGVGFGTVLPALYCWQWLVMAGKAK